jgi:hypothetical protein
MKSLQKAFIINHINLSDVFIYRASVATKESRENKSID